MKIGIFGGTFNPPHKGHIFTAEKIIEKGLADKVLFMVAAAPPHKAYVGTSQEHRFNMTKTALDGERLIACDYEIKKGGKSYSYETLCEMRKKYPDDEIKFIMGADMFMNLPTWYEAHKLRKEFSFILVDRVEAFKNSVFKEFAEKQINEFDMKVEILEIRTPDISSTDIRERVKKGLDIKELVEEKVEEYITQNNLYKKETDTEIIINAIKNKLSEKRFKHCENVANVAVKLAKIYGVDEEKAYLAGYAHDIAKELTLDEMNELTLHLELDDHIRSSKALLHALAGACYLKKTFDISDDIYNACFYHTMGRPDMSMFEKVIFMADYIEPGRNFEGIDEIRALTYEDIDLSIVKAINSTLAFLIKNNKKIYYKTVLTRNFYINE